jgi:hypothetical protein
LPAGSVSAQTIAVSGERVIFDSREIQLPQNEETFKSALGGSPILHDELADEYSNRVLWWLNLGIVAFSNPRNLKVHAVELLVSKPAYWRGLPFQGSLKVEGTEIVLQSLDVSQLSKLGFCERNGSWEWRSGCMYVLVLTDGGRAIASIEVGHDEDDSVLPPLLRKHSNNACDQAPSQ